MKKYIALLLLAIVYAAESPLHFDSTDADVLILPNYPDYTLNYEIANTTSDVQTLFCFTKAAYNLTSHDEKDLCLFE